AARSRGATRSCGLPAESLRPYRRRRLMPVAFAQPLAVVSILELEERPAQLLDGLERPHPQQLLLERSNETRGDAIARGLAHEGRTGSDAEELQLVLKVVTHVLAAVIVPRLQPGGDSRRVAPEDRPHTLPQRLHRFEARPGPGRVEADALSGTMV